MAAMLPRIVCRIPTRIPTRISRRGVFHTTPASISHRLIPTSRQSVRTMHARGGRREDARAVLLQLGIRAFVQVGTYLWRTGFFQKYPKALAVFLGAPIIGGGAYYGAHLERVPVTGRLHAVFLTPEHEVELGVQAREQIVQNEGEHILPSDSQVAQTVLEIAENIVTASGEHDLPWEVFVIDSDVQNAFVLPGGKIFVYTGILEACHNHGGLAFVLGHEVSHALARHSVEKMGVSVACAVLETALYELWTSRSGDLTTFTVGALGSLLMTAVRIFGVETAYSRHLESEAGVTCAWVPTGV